MKLSLHVIQVHCCKHDPVFFLVYFLWAHPASPHVPCKYTGCFYLWWQLKSARIVHRLRATNASERGCFIKTWNLEDENSLTFVCWNDTKTAFVAVFSTVLLVTETPNNKWSRCSQSLQVAIHQGSVACSTQEPFTSDVNYSCEFLLGYFSCLCAPKR